MAWWSWFVNLSGNWFSAAMPTDSMEVGMARSTDSTEVGMSTMAMPTDSMELGVESDSMELGMAMPADSMELGMAMPAKSGMALLAATNNLGMARPAKSGMAQPAATNNSGMARPAAINNSGMARPAASNFGGDEKPSTVSIFRVPNFLKQSRERGAYVPKIVSLGSYHRRNAKLLAMEKHKERALSRMMTRFSSKRNNDSNNMDFSSRAKEEILSMKAEIRKSYEEEIGCKSKDLASMLCLDGCFILEILRTLGGDKFPGGGASNCYEPIFEKNRIDYTGFDILNDILKLENQVPLIVLRKLLQLEQINSKDVEAELFRCLVICPESKFYPFNYTLQQKTDEHAHHLLGLLHSLIVCVPCQNKHDNTPLEGHRQAQPDQTKPEDCASELQPQPDEHAHHLLGLLHSLIVSGPCKNKHDNIPLDGHRQAQPDKTNKAVNAAKRIPRAGKLKNAGIKFKACDAGIRKITFEQESGTLCLPQMYVTDHTEVLFRNLIALELCNASDINYVTCYVSLMDELIDLEEDVGVLRESEILTNYLGSDAEVAKLFNGLCNRVTMSQIDAFLPLKEQVHQQYTSRFKVHWAEFMKNYISSPWRTLALVGAVFGLLLTLLQTIFSIIAVYK